jgi:ribonuclease VapC
MFLDASAVVAILKREPEREELLSRLEKIDTVPRYSPLSRFEAIVSLARAEAGKDGATTAAGLDGARLAVDRLFSDLGAENIDLTEAVGTGALTAAQTYGRGVGHPAALNLGDCFAYACAKEAKVALLYKGGDFARTDLA